MKVCTGNLNYVVRPFSEVDSRNHKSLLPRLLNAKSLKKQGAIDRSFLLDTVRHISRY